MHTQIFVQSFNFEPYICSGIWNGFLTFHFWLMNAALCTLPNERLILSHAPPSAKHEEGFKLTYPAWFFSLLYHFSSIMSAHNARRERFILQAEPCQVLMNGSRRGTIRSNCIPPRTPSAKIHSDDTVSTDQAQQAALCSRLHPHLLGAVVIAGLIWGPFKDLLFLIHSCWIRKWDGSTQSCL